jgi:hypothetical protein
VPENRLKEAQPKASFARSEKIMRRNSCLCLCVFTFALALLTLVLNRPSRNAAAEERPGPTGKANAVERANEALIVFESLQTVPGFARLKTIRITDRKALASLEAMFPKYVTLPTSDMHAASEQQYTIYFSFAGGKGIRVNVSHGNEKDWWIGDGDFPVQGNLDALIEQIQKKLPE